MKLIVLLVFTTFLQVSASTYAQNVTLNEHNASLAKVFSKIKEQTGYLFLYNQEWIAMARKVDIVVTKAPLEEVLNACFSNQPLTYAIVNKTIVLKLKENYATKPVQTAIAEPPVSIPIKGTVNDEKGKPLPGVSVSVKGTKTGTQTDINGTYALNVPDAGGILVFTFIGYERQEVRIGSKAIIDISLSPRSDLLSEVVVSGYTVQNRAEFTGSSAHIGAKTSRTGRCPVLTRPWPGKLRVLRSPQTAAH